MTKIVPPKEVDKEEVDALEEIAFLDGDLEEDFDDDLAGLHEFSEEDEEDEGMHGFTFYPDEDEEEDDEVEELDF